MRQTIFGIALALTLVAGLAPAVADDDSNGEKKFTITGEVRARWEYFENLSDFVDQDDPGDLFDDNYDLWPYRVRIAADGRFSKNVSGRIELQNFGAFGNETPFKSPTYPPFQTEESGFDPDDTNLYQGYLQLTEIGGSHANARIGRQEHTLGNELHMGDSDFYNGQSFDGARAWWNFEKWNIGGFYYNLSENNAGCTGFCGSDNVDFFGATASFMVGDRIEIEPYVLNFRSQTDFDPIYLTEANFLTLGARATRAVSSRDDVEDGHFDWNGEIAIQDGDLGPTGAEVDQSAWIAEGWVGYNWNCGDDGRSRVHLGALITSGDDDPVDDENNGYLWLFPDFHADNRLGDSDLEQLFFNYGFSFPPGVFATNGVTDFNVGYEYFGGKHGFMGSFHNMTLTEDFCVGLTCENDLGQEIDVRYDYAYSSQLGFQVGIADFMPGDAIALAGGGDDDGLRVWGQARLRF